MFSTKSFVLSFNWFLCCTYKDGKDLGPHPIAALPIADWDFTRRPALPLLLIIAWKLLVTTTLLSMSSGSISFLFCSFWCNWYRIVRKIISKVDLEKAASQAFFRLACISFGQVDQHLLVWMDCGIPKIFWMKLVPQVITAGELAEWNQQSSSQGHPLPPSIY